MNAVYNLSSGPHVRGRLSTRRIMLDVILALLPTTVIGVWVHGWRALLVILLSVGTAAATEFLFDRITKRKNTVGDCSALVTGLLLALTLPARVPFYIPVLGALFAILVVKCLFGGLGHNIVNPALAGRSFLLISFGAAMTGYTVGAGADAVTSATPLAQLAAGETVDLMALAIGKTSGVIGSSALGLVAGGVYLLLSGGITLEIPLSMIVTTTLFMGFFGDKGFALPYLLPQVLGGGLLMAAFFMATDPVTCPSTSKGQVGFGVFAGLLIGIFRVWGGAADSTTYAILLADLVGPIIDDILIPVPFGYRIPKDRKAAIPKPVIILLVVTLIAGLALGGVYYITADKIAENAKIASRQAYAAVCPGAQRFDDAPLREALEAVKDGPYGESFGGSMINDAVLGLDDQGNVLGCVVSVTSTDAYDGNLTLVVGIAKDGTVQKIAFTELHETAGMGMKCGEAPFMDQFAGVKVDAFTLNKGAADGDKTTVDTVTGASKTSGAVVNAVNAALDFYAKNRS